MTPWAPRFYILLPGIRTNPSDWRNWAPRMATEINLLPEPKADEFRYFAMALSPKGRQDERAQYVASLATRAKEQGFSPVLVAHSNGCEIVRQALLSLGPIIHSAHLVAGATEADFDKGGWNKILTAHPAMHLCCYKGTRDWVLRWVAAAGAFLGYGRLGYLGPQNVAKEHEDRVTVITRDLDHCGWFEGENFKATFDAITVAERMHAIDIALAV